MENLIGSRFKSDDSILRKYEKTLRTGGGFKQCFNDVLGFRLRLESYPTDFQLWCGKDYWFNTWSHQYVYKYEAVDIGKKLYDKYCAGVITTEDEFKNN